MKRPQRYRPLLIEDRNETCAPDAGDGLSLRRALRTETHALHTRLDGLFDGMADADDPAAYHRFIRMNEACHRALEPALATSGLAEAVPSWRPADRTAALAADLVAMRIEPLPPLALAIPHPGVPDAIGIAYVLEGSRLGAGYILSALRARTDSGAGWDGASYAYLEMPDRPHALRGFLAEAALVLTPPEDLARCIAAANATFAYFLATSSALLAARPEVPA